MGVSIESIKENLKQAVYGGFRGGHCDKDFIKLGYVDSINIVKLLLNIEKNYGVVISIEEVASPEFRTINGLADIIYKRIYE